MPAATFETLLFDYRQNVGAELCSALWGNRPLAWLQQDLFGTSEAGRVLYLIQSAFEEFTQAPEGYCTIRFWGHGMNSHAFYFQRVEPWCRIWLRLPFGGLYSDHQEDSKQIRTVMAWLPGFFRHAQQHLQHITLMDVMDDCYCRFEQQDGAFTEGGWSALRLHCLRWMTCMRTLNSEMRYSL